MLQTVERHYDGHWINRVANDPSVYPWVKGWHLGRIDLSAVAEDRKNWCLCGEHGAVVFTELQRGIYEAHTLMLPEGRGPWCLDFCRCAEHIIFTQSPAVELLTRVPKGNLAARALGRALGWSFEFRNERGWIMDKDPIPADIFALRIQDWAKTAPGLEERGHWFHEKLEAEFAAHGKAEPPHGDDRTHDRYVGLCAEMLLNGQPDKGVVFYNRVAAMAGYQQIAIAQYAPLLVEIVSAQIIVSPERQDFWAPLVR